MPKELVRSNQVISYKNGSSGSYYGTIINSFAVLDSNYFSNSNGVLTCKKACTVFIVPCDVWRSGVSWSRTRVYKNNSCVIDHSGVNGGSKPNTISLAVGNTLFAAV